MSFKIQYTTVFAKALKRPAKNYPLMSSGYAELLDDLGKDPATGTAIGRGCYKVRMSIGSKGKGRSGGARGITDVRVVNKLVVLLTMYDKREKENTTEKERDQLIALAEQL